MGHVEVECRQLLYLSERSREKSREVVMTAKFRLILSYSLAALIGIGIAPSLARAQSTLYSVTSGDDLLRTVNPANGATLSSVAIALPGFTVDRANGLATHPTTGELFALLGIALDATCPGSVGPLSRQRRLVKINPATGVATSIGNTGDCFAALAFHTNGTLYGVTGDGAGTPAALFTINTTTAAPTFLMFLPNSSGDGEALAFNPNDGLLYHLSGRISSGPRVFQSINPATLVVTNIPLSGSDSDEFTALTHSTGSFLAAERLGAFFSITTGGFRTLLGSTASDTKGLAFVTTTPSGPLVAAVLPSSRAVQVGTPATAFATIINAGTTTATSCGIALLSSIPANFSYQTTNPATNQVTGTPNTPVNIGAGLSQSYVFALTPTAPIAPTDVLFTFDCTNTNPAANISGVNTLLFLGSAGPTSDIVALAGTVNNDGIVNIPGTFGTGVFVVATVNVGVSASITASVDTGGTTLPVNLFICQTNPVTSVCLAPLSSTVTLTINANETPTFGIFVQGTGNVAFDPATNRIFVRFKDAGAVTHGSTSVAVRTQ
jgi:hypothetical protein